MLKIWGRSNSSNVQKVLWACDEMKLPFERIDAGMDFGVVKEPAYMKMNPNSRVPTIVEDDGFVLWESNAIVRYLGAKHGTGPLSPADPRVRADADRWMDWASIMFLPGFTPLYWQLIRTPAGKRDGGAIDRAIRDCGERLSVLEQGLEGKQYVAGSQFTMGDLPIGVSLYRWFALDVKRPSQPNVEAYYQRLAQRPAYQRNIMMPLS